MIHEAVVFFRALLPAFILLETIFLENISYTTNFYNEKFNNDFYAIDIFMEVSPKSFFKKLNGHGYIYFSAVVNSNGEEKSVYGYRVKHNQKIYYCFNMENKFFIGELVEKTSYALLRYIIMSNNKILEKGTLYSI